MAEIKRFPQPPQTLINLGPDVALWLQRFEQVYNQEQGIELERVNIESSDITHNETSGLQGGSSTDRYHQTQGDNEAAQGKDIVNTSVDYVATYSDGLVLVDSSGDAVEVTLPSSQSDFKEIFVNVQTGGNDVTVTPDGSDTINGDASLVIEYENSNAQLAAISGGWAIV